MKVFLDANVIIDVLTAREPFFRDSQRVVDYCERHSESGFLSSLTFCTAAYILRKSVGKDELPGLRGFSAASIKYMRLFFDEWMKWFEIRHLASDESPARPIRQMPSDENNDLVRSAELGETALIQIRQTTSAESVSPDNRPTSLGESVIRSLSTNELATCRWRMSI